MSSPSADRNLVFGLLALQLDYVTPRKCSTPCSPGR
jgi:hypothetical protein